jgi:outer membrane protein assembly factor BamB
MRMTFIALSTVLYISVARAADWPQWRGPNFNGFTDAVGLPDKLDPAGDLLWSTPLPGGSSSSPVVAGGKIFVSTIDGASRKLLALCLDGKTGKIVWQRSLGIGYADNERNNLASPSPVADGKHVWFYFGTGDLACFDADGNAVWSRNIQKDYGNFSVQWLYASSPLLNDGKLYVQVLHRSEDSYLLILDAMTGKELGRQQRPNDAREESKESYATPIPNQASGATEILLIGGDAVTAHDPANGRELWRFGGWNPNKINHWRVITSLVAVDGLVIACAPKGGPIMAIKDGGSGDITAAGCAWSTREISSDVCVPLVMNGDLYVLEGDRRKLLRVEPTTGHVKQSVDLPGSVFRASPTGADGKIFVINENGDTWTLDAATLKVLSKSSLGGRPSRASIAVAEGEVIVRTAETVYAFAAGK